MVKNDGKGLEILEIFLKSPSIKAEKRTRKVLLGK